MTKLRGFVLLILTLVLYTVPVCGANYIVTVKEGADVSGWNIEPVFEEIGLFIADEITAKELYAKGLASSITEDKPLLLPEVPVENEQCYESSELVPMLLDFNDTYYNEEYYFSQCGIKDYMDTYNPSGKVRIAVIDTGVNKQHLEFVNANIETGYNFVTDTTDTTDLFRHGTMVTGVLAATANNGMGMAGVAPDATIVPLVAMTKVDGVTKGTGAHLLLAMRAAVDTYDCKIISTSLGVTSGYSEINKVVKYAESKGVIVISAAGNSGTNSDSGIASQLSYPASSPCAISVGAIDANYNRAAYSQKNERVDVATFGGMLTMPSISGVSSYVRANGTSFSTPVVAGITALFVSNHPDITPEEYRRILKGGAMDIGISGGSDFMGAGMPDMMAMEKMYNDSNPVFISPVYKGESVNIKLAANADISEALLVATGFDNGFMTSYTLTPVTFTDGIACISGTDCVSVFKYFVLNSLDSMQSFSSAVEY